MLANVCEREGGGERERGEREGREGRERGERGEREGRERGERGEREEREREERRERERGGEGGEGKGEREVIEIVLRDLEIMEPLFKCI